MTTTRRGFLQACLALCVAPAIVRADSLMRVVPRDTTVLTAMEVSITIDQLREVVPTYYRGNFTQLVRETFLKHREQIAQNVQLSNSILKKYDQFIQVDDNDSLVIVTGSLPED